LIAAFRKGRKRTWNLLFGRSVQSGHALEACLALRKQGGF
jgi:hypothetical protein